MESRDTLVHPGRTDRTRRDPPAAAAGVALGRYRLVERLGAGGFGVVWRAHDEVLDREVALKRITLPSGEGGARATREALAAARLAHPAIVSLYEACAEGDTFVLVSELVPGETLAALIAANRLADSSIAEVGLALADALAHAHSRGVIHRDVKPQNVLVPQEPDAGGAPAKLADFGGARLAGEQTLTRTGDVVGTLAYMAPEQANSGVAEEEADLYSLALVLYEAFSGANPVRGATPAATARKLGRRLPPLASRRPDLPRDLCRAIDAALDPRPHRRHTVEDLSDALADALEQGLAERPSRRRGPRAAPAAIDEAEDPDGWAPAPADVARASAAARAATPRGGEPYDEAASRAGAVRRDARPPPARAGEELPHAPVASPHVGLRLRAACAVPAAGLAAAVVSARSLGGPAPPVGAPVAAASAALVVGLAPRLGWAALATASVAWVAAGGHAGAAALIAVAALAVVALLRQPGPGWSVPALAPLLGLVGLAGAYVAVAGQARAWPRRAALGALGYWWLLLAEPLLGRRLWLGPPAAAAAHAAAGWQASATKAAAHVLWPLLTTGTLLGALLWAAASAALPWAVSGRTLALDLVGATMWAAALYTAQPLVAAGSHAGPVPRGALAGVTLAAGAAVALRAARRSRPAGPSRPPRPGRRDVATDPVSGPL